MCSLQYPTSPIIVIFGFVHLCPFKRLRSHAISVWFPMLMSVLNPSYVLYKEAPHTSYTVALMQYFPVSHISSSLVGIVTSCNEA